MELPENAIIVNSTLQLNDLMTETCDLTQKVFKLIKMVNHITMQPEIMVILVDGRSYVYSVELAQDYKQELEDDEKYFQAEDRFFRDPFYSPINTSRSTTDDTVSSITL